MASPMTTKKITDFSSSGKIRTHKRHGIPLAKLPKTFAREDIAEHGTAHSHR
jgi:hypothetical protein